MENQKENIESILFKKMVAIQNRSGMNVQSGHVMMDVYDRNWLFDTMTNLLFKVKRLEKELEQLR